MTKIELENMLKSGVCEVRYHTKSYKYAVKFVTLNRELIESIKSDFRMRNKKNSMKILDKDTFSLDMIKELRDNDFVVRDYTRVFDYENKYWIGVVFNSIIEAKVINSPVV